MLYKLLLPALIFFTLTTYAQTDTLRTALPAAQSNDTIVHKDSIRNAVKDSVNRLAIQKFNWQQDTSYKRLLQNLYGGGKKQPFFMITPIREQQNKDLLFYLLMGLVLLVAIVRSLFPKYFHNIFRLFFQSTYRQKQSKESLMQASLPSLVLNICFLLSGGLFVALLIVDSPRLYQVPFWLLWIYACIALAVVYIGKFLFISFCGWVFNSSQLSFNYNFIVFLINKVAGICLLPLLMLMAFSEGDTYTTTVTIALTFIVLMLLYRYIVALSTVVKNLKVSAVHFFIYLCAVEILPLLVIYKLLFIAIR